MLSVDIFDGHFKLIILNYIVYYTNDQVLITFESIFYFINTFLGWSPAKICSNDEQGTENFVQSSHFFFTGLI